ncbi:MAG: Fic family protein [Actinomycetota bacterium]
MIAQDLPPIPDVAADLVAAHRRSRSVTRARLVAMDDGPARVLRWCLINRLIESMANVFQDDRQLVLPPRRRHLRPAMDARVAGSAVAFRHIDSRLEMRRLGHVADVVGHETPFVLHAFAEGHSPGADETNPGLVRATSSAFDAVETTYRPPDGERCSDLLAGCVETVNASDHDAAVRAAWMAAAFLAIHPFVDGNGRTARMLFQLVASTDDDLRLDWGSLEQWSIARRPYIDALKATQAPSLPTYDPELIDTQPFVEFALRASAVGADLIRRRIDWIEWAWERGVPWPSTTHALLELATVMSASATIDELSALVADPDCTTGINELVAAGRLRWDDRGLLRPATDHPLLIDERAVSTS